MWTDGALLRARDVTLTLDLRAATLTDARIDLRGPPGVVLRTPMLSVQGAAPFALPLAVDHLARTVAILVAALGGAFASFLALTLRRESRPVVALLVSGAAPALSALAWLDARAPGGAFFWLALPIVAVLPTVLFLARGRGARRGPFALRDD